MFRKTRMGDFSRYAPRILGGSKLHVKGIRGRYMGRSPPLMAVLFEQHRETSHIASETGHCNQSRSQPFTIIENGRAAYGCSSWTLPFVDRTTNSILQLH